MLAALEHLIVTGLVFVAFATGIIFALLTCGALCLWAKDAHEGYRNRRLMGWERRELFYRWQRRFGLWLIKRSDAAEDRRIRSRQLQAQAEIDGLLSIPHPGEWPAWPNREEAI